MSNLKLDIKNDGATPEEALGVKMSLADKLIKRFKVFMDESHEEATERATKHLGSRELAEKWIHECDDPKERLKVTGIAFTYLDDLDRFLQSGLFKTLNWELKTANDFFALGYVIGAFVFYRNSQENGLEELTKILSLIEKTVKNEEGDKVWQKNPMRA